MECNEGDRSGDRGHRLELEDAVWSDGTRTRVDAITWCTGFRPTLEHLAPLEVLNPAGHIGVQGGHAVGDPWLWLVGYGDWTVWPPPHSPE